MGEGEDTVARLQAYLREEARPGAVVVAVPPLTLFLRPGDAPDGDDLAVPDVASDADWAGALARVRAATRGRGRVPRVRYLAEFAPALAAALVADGYREEGRVPLLACAAGALRQPPDVPGLTLATLDAAAPLAAVRENLDVNATGFDPAALPATEAEAEDFRRDLAANRAATAYLGGVAVAAGMFTPPLGGVAELAGITTLAPYRGRGIAAALTAHLARVAFALGADLLFLSANTPGARRVYERLGFRQRATAVTYTLA